MKPIKMEEEILQLQGKVIQFDYEIASLKEEIHELKKQLLKQVEITPSVKKIGYRTFDPERVKEVMKQSKLNKKFKT